MTVAWKLCCVSNMLTMNHLISDSLEVSIQAEEVPDLSFHSLHSSLLYSLLPCLTSAEMPSGDADADSDEDNDLRQVLL